MNWQIIIAILLLAAAVFYIIRSLRKSFRSEHNCEHCDAYQQDRKARRLPAHLQEKQN